MDSAASHRQHIKGKTASRIHGVYLDDDENDPHNLATDVKHLIGENAVFVFALKEVDGPVCDKFQQADDPKSSNERNRAAVNSCVRAHVVNPHGLVDLLTRWNHCRINRAVAILAFAYLRRLQRKIA